MTNTTPSFTPTQPLDRAFLLSVTWAETAGNWRIQLRPVNGDAVRLFSDVESVLVYLEMVMQAQQAQDMHKGTNNTTTAVDVP